MSRRVVPFGSLRLSAVAALVLAGCLAWPALGLGSSRHTAANSQTFTDATGDSGNAPDVTTVAVSNDDAGKITFAITFANRSSLSANDVVLLAMDTNGNLSDGIGGADYVATVIGPLGVLFNASGGALNPASAPSFTSSFSAGVETISVNKADIGNPTQINFVLVASGDAGATAPEAAPDSGLWTYQVMTAPPPPPPPPPLKLTASKPVVSKAVAGKTFTVSFTVTDASTGKGVAGNVSCSARLGGKRLSGAHHTSSASGKATCSWRLPKNAHGKQLRGTIAESSQGQLVSRSFLTRVA